MVAGTRVQHDWLSEVMEATIFDPVQSNIACADHQEVLGANLRATRKSQSRCLIIFGGNWPVVSRLLSRYVDGPLLQGGPNLNCSGEKIELVTLITVRLCLGWRLPTHNVTNQGSNQDTYCWLLSWRPGISFLKILVEIYLFNLPHWQSENLKLEDRGAMPWGF